MVSVCRGFSLSVSQRLLILAALRSVLSLICHDQKELVAASAVPITCVFLYAIAFLFVLLMVQS